MAPLTHNQSRTSYGRPPRPLCVESVPRAPRRRIGRVLFAGILLPALLIVMLSGRLPAQQPPSPDQPSQQPGSKAKSHHKGTTQPHQGAAALLGATTRTGMFGLFGDGQKFVYVFDASGSMTLPEGKPIAAVKKEMIESLKTLDRMHQFEIIYYGSSPHHLDLTGGTGRQLFATDDVKAAAKTAVMAVQVEASTQHEPALLMALHMRPDVIFFMTDGDDPALDRQQLERIDRLNEGRAVIHAIQLGDPKVRKESDWMKSLAHQNGGDYTFVDVQKLNLSP